eukprot:gene12004-13243_t
MSRVCLIACFLLIFGLVACQDGDLSFINGSGDKQSSGDEDKIMTTVKAPVRKVVFTTRIPDDTEVDNGSGEDSDGESPRPTKIITDTDDTVEEISGSGEGSGVVDVNTKSPWDIANPTTMPQNTKHGVTTKKMEMVTGEATTDLIEEITSSGDGYPTMIPQEVSTKMFEATTETVEEITHSGEHVFTVPANTIGNEIFNNIETTSAAPTRTKPPVYPKTSENDPDDRNTVDNIHSSTKSPMGPEDKTTTMSNSLENNNKHPTEKSPGKENNADTQKSRNPKSKKKPGLSFTTGIIIGVITGAILAILIILFLVYRLRKKDEGSYLLDERYYGSAPYARQEPGSPTSDKEYFA